MNSAATACRPISAARSPPAPDTSSTAIRPTIRWRSIRPRSTSNGIPDGACWWLPSRSFPVRTELRCWRISSRPTTASPIGSWAFPAAPSCWRATDSEQPLIFNRIAIGLRFDTDKKRVLLTQADISNGEIGVAGTGSVDYSGEPRLTLGFAGHADVGIGAEADVADPDRSRGPRMGDRAGRARLAAEHRDRRQVAGAKPFAARPADSG